MTNTNELTNRINERYSSLSKGQKRLATYITDNYDRAVFLTAARLGEIVGVNQRLSGLPFIWDIRAIRNFRRPWRNWCATS